MLAIGKDLLVSGWKGSEGRPLLVCNSRRMLEK